MRTDRSVEFDDAIGGALIAGRHFADGVSQSGHERNRLFLSREGRQFDDVSTLSGLDSQADGRSFAWLDFDRDGWLDIALVNANAPLFELFRNEFADHSADNRFIAVELEGGNQSALPDSRWSARDGYGAVVEVHLGDRVLRREHRAGEGFAAENSARMLFGIGTADSAERVRVHWSSGRTQEALDVAAGNLIAFREREGPSDAGERRAYITPSLPGPIEKAAVEAPTKARPLAIAADSEGQPGALRVFTSMATWCEVCQRELVQVRLIREMFDAPHSSRYGVPVDDTDTPEKLATWNALHRPAYTLLLDASADAVVDFKRSIERALRRDALPASIVTDAEGRAMATFWGVPTVSDLRALLATDAQRVGNP